MDMQTPIALQSGKNTRADCFNTYLFDPIGKTVLLWNMVLITNTKGAGD